MRAIIIIALAVAATLLLVTDSGPERRAQNAWEAALEQLQGVGS